MTLIDSLKSNSSKHEDPFKHWIVDKPFSDETINEIYKIPIPEGEVIFDGTRA